jgi:predicted membrane protein
MDYNKYQHGYKNTFDNRGQEGRIILGIVLALIGVGLLLKTFGVFPAFIRFSWPMTLVIIGIVVGVKNKFRNNTWWILIAVGVAHMIPAFEIFGKSSRKLVWPLLLVALGLMMVFRPKRKNCNPEIIGGSFVNEEDRLVTDIIFGGRKEIVTSKDFKGGTVSVTFGGSEINLTQADFTSNSILIECRVAFGAIELVIPANWELQNEIKPAFGSVEDERVIYGSTANENKKRLVLTGSCNFGGINIKSY